ncbi:MAG: hypothetical protein J6R92_04540 [Akkermansia sp.]|nr:hypothetical protein [Akkermansia sp.]
MADYSSRRTTITRVSLFALLGIVFLVYAFLSLEGTEKAVFVGCGLFDLIYAAIISTPLWRRKN